MPLKYVNENLVVWKVGNTFVGRNIQVRKNCGELKYFDKILNFIKYYDRFYCKT
jgi:hypothetical protein